MALAVEQHVVRVVREQVERVEVRRLAKVGLGGQLEVLLLKLTRDGVLVAEDEVDLEDAWQCQNTHCRHKTLTGMLRATRARVRSMQILARPSTHLGARASQVRTKHDGPWRLVIELLSSGLETVFEELDVATTAVAALLVFDLVLDDERLVGEFDGLLEGC